MQIKDSNIGPIEEEAKMGEGKMTMAGEQLSDIEDNAESCNEESPDTGLAMTILETNIHR